MNLPLTESAPVAAQCSVLLYEHTSPRRANRSIKLKLGEHVRIDADHIQRYCFSDGDPMQEDIAAVLSAVRMADRACNRRHSKGWTRDLRVEVPVFNLDCWQSTAVLTCLIDALQYQTGDRWHFAFKHRRSKASSPNQPHLVDLPAQERIFMPYSHGLDSFALASPALRP